MRNELFGFSPFIVKLGTVNRLTTRAVVIRKVAALTSSEYHEISCRVRTYYYGPSNVPDT